jgi:hypothetical protein
MFEKNYNDICVYNKTHKNENENNKIFELYVNTEYINNGSETNYLYTQFSIERVQQVVVNKIKIKLNEVIERGCFYSNLLDIQNYKVKLEQFNQIDNRYPIDNFLFKYSNLVNKTTLIQNRFAMVDTLSINFLKQTFNIEETYVMVSKKPKNKGVLEEVSLKGDYLYQYKQTVNYISNKIFTIFYIHGFYYKGRCWQEKLTFTSESIYSETYEKKRNIKQISLRDMLILSTAFEVDIDELTFKHIFIANISTEVIPLVSNNWFRVITKYIDFNTPFDSTSVHEFFNSVILSYVYAFFKIRFGIFKLQPIGITVNTRIYSHNSYNKNNNKVIVKKQHKSRFLKNKIINKK